MFGIICDNVAPTQLIHESLGYSGKILFILAMVDWLSYLVLHHACLD